MRLTGKFIVALTCAILIVLGVNAYVRVTREVGLLEDDIRRDSRHLGRTLAGAVARIWTTVGEAEAVDLVEDANARWSHVVIGWLWLDAGGGAHPVLDSAARARLVRGEEVCVRAAPDDLGDSLFTYVPVVLPDNRHAAIELRESLAARHSYVRRTVVQAMVATGVLVLLCGLLATGLGILLIGRPVRQLVAQARRIGTGDLSVAPAPARRDELGDLAREMNSTCERLVAARAELEDEIAARLATQQQLRHADRLTTVGKLAAGIAHEVGTPLNVITGHCQLIREDHPADGAAHRSAAIIAEQAHRVANIIRQLLDFARQRTLHKQSHDLSALARQTTALLDSLAQKSNVTLVFVEPEDVVCAEVDAGQIEQVVVNLVVNGIQSMRAGGLLTVGIEPVRPAPAGAGQACIYVEDHGAGIAATELPHIFEPFFTTKGVGEGTGLGLSVAYGIVEEHGGHIEVDSEVGKGSRFAVYLPAEDVCDQECADRR